MTTTSTIQAPSGVPASEPHTAPRRRAGRKSAGIAVLALGFLLTPLMVQDSYLYLLCYSAVLAIAAIGVVLLVGRAGNIWIAQPLFMGIGAYTAVWVWDTYGLGFVGAVVAAVLLTAVVGALTGWLSLRLSGLELAIVSFGVVIIGDYLANLFDSITGGAGGTVSSVEVGLGPLGFEPLGSFTAEQSLFWALWGVVILTAALAVFLLHRAPGRTWTSLRDNERASEAIGVNVRAEQVAVFALASGIGGLSGAMLAGLREYLSPDDFSFAAVTLLMAVVIIGGVDRIAGAVIGALLVPGIEFLVAEHVDSTALGWLIQTTSSDDGYFSVGSFNMLVFGGLILLVLLIEPTGVAGGMQKILDSFRSPRHRSGKGKVSK